jgi:hypothetical protein
MFNIKSHPLVLPSKSTAMCQQVVQLQSAGTGCRQTASDQGQTYHTGLTSSGRSTPRPRLMDSTVPAVPHSARMLPQKNALQT